MKNLLMTAMTNSIFEVLETMFFLALEFVEDPDQDSVRAIKTQPGKACCLSFSGDVSGSVCLMVPEDLLLEMTENFMGEDRDTLQAEHLEGTLSEIVNMVCGNALRNIDATTPFELGIPEIQPVSEFPETEPFTIIEASGLQMAFHIRLS